MDWKQWGGKSDSRTQEEMICLKAEEIWSGNCSRRIARFMYIQTPYLSVLFPPSRSCYISAEMRALSCLGWFCDVLIGTQRGRKSFIHRDMTGKLPYIATLSQPCRVSGSCKFKIDIRCKREVLMHWGMTLQRQFLAKNNTNKLAIQFYISSFLPSTLIAWIILRKPSMTFLVTNQGIRLEISRWPRVKELQKK